MILADTSIWIELLGGRLQPPEDLRPMTTCAPVIQEVLQGLRPGSASEVFREAFLALPILSNPVSLDLYLAAADIYRQGRRKGITIRSGVDCLIAAIAIHNRVPVWHRDRDFDSIATYTALDVF